MSLTTAEALVAELQVALPGTLASFSRGLLAEMPAASVGIDDLLSPQQCSDILGYLDARLGAVDRRAALSIWAGWHFRSVIPPLLAANILLDVSPRLDLDAIRFVISVDRRADRIVVPAPLDDLSGEDRSVRFAGLVDTYLAPLIDRFAERTRLTRRVLWSNAGQVFESFLRLLEPTAAGRPGLAAARRLLATPHGETGDRNPLFEPVRYLDGQRVRRVCCMRYLFPDGLTCGPCPLNLRRREAADPASRDAGDDRRGQTRTPVGPTLRP